jgi:hypothetical protein
VLLLPGNIEVSREREYDTDVYIGILAREYDTDVYIEILVREYDTDDYTEILVCSSQEIW